MSVSVQLRGPQNWRLRHLSTAGIHHAAGSMGVLTARDLEMDQLQQLGSSFKLFVG